MTLKFTDENGKEFAMSLSEITDMTGDLPSDYTNLNDSTHHNFTLHVPKIYDMKGETIDAAALLDSIKQDSKNRPRALDVVFEATHSGTNKNNMTYPSDALEQGTSSWLTPFPKPLIKNHDLYEEPIGRVVDAYFGQSELADGLDTINVVFRVTDADAVDKFLDRRYSTMSIGASCGNIRCNVCGKDIVKDGEFKFCGHMKGQKYGTQLATWTARDFEFKEGSIVNNPADVWAQVKKVTVVNDEELNKKGVKDMEDNKKTPNVQDSTKDDANIIDGILADNEQEKKEPQPDSIADNEKASKVEDDDNKMQTLEDEIATLKEEAVKLKEELQQTKDALEASEQDTKVLQDKVEEVEAQLADKEVVISDNKKQNVRLAMLNKKLMVERIVDFEVVTRKLEDANKEARITELSSMKASELSDMMVFDWTATDDATKRQMATQVSNPGLADNDTEKNVIKDSSTTGEAETAKEVVTMKDFEKTLIDLFTR